MRAIACVTLQYKAKQYYFEYAWTSFNNWTADDYRETIPYWWEEGNGSCDCNRSLSIQHYCDPTFAEMECGDKIDLVSVDVKILDNGDMNVSISSEVRTCGGADNGSKTNP